MSIDKSISVNQLLIPLHPFLQDKDITEIVINKPGQVYVEKGGQWVSFETDDLKVLTFNYLMSLGTAVAAYAGENVMFESTVPILSAVLPGGERAQFVMPPACKDGTLSITIRKPSFAIWPLETYESDGFFDKIRPADTSNTVDAELLELYQHLHDAPYATHHRLQFLRRCVQLNKNIVIAGETGSGKTTFMKSLMQAIPEKERIITIEDVPELLYGLPKHDNQVNLFYPSEGKTNSAITVASLLRSCLRMKPDRILLAELRGGETYDFLNVCLSGHGGSITSCHAGSCSGVFEYLALKVLQSETGKALPYEVIRKLLYLTIDVVIHIHNDRNIGRHITEIWFDPSKKTL